MVNMHRIQELIQAMMCNSDSNLELEAEDFWEYTIRI